MRPVATASTTGSTPRATSSPHHAVASRRSACHSERKNCASGRRVSTRRTLPSRSGRPDAVPERPEVDLAIGGLEGLDVVHLVAPVVAVAAEVGSAPARGRGALVGEEGVDEPVAVAVLPARPEEHLHALLG